MKKYRYAKKNIDMILAFILLVCLIIIPVIPIVCLLIFFDNPGPVFYFQNRVGKDGKIFKIIKFRSMFIGAEKKLEKCIETGEYNPLDFKKETKDEYTRLGKIIRKTSIDELPQLLNILKGEMSFIGPRPIQQFEIESYLSKMGEEGKIILEMRESVLPGLLCYWQVSKDKDKISFHERMKLDIDYVQNISFIEDSKIFIRGILTVLRLGNY
ncbi:TPA: sugar transferase [Streptococcus suis]